MERTINDVKTDLLGLDYITLELPKPLALRAKEVAKQTGQHLEEMLVEWIDRLATDPPIEYHPDDQILALCDLQMNVAQQDELSDLLARNKEGLLAKKENERLDELMHIYRHGLIHKAKALKIAVKRGLKHPLN